VELSDERAAKIRELAKVVITTDRKKGIVAYDPNKRIGDSYQGVQAVLVIGAKKYTVWVANNKDKSNRDLISFWVRPQGTHKIKDLVAFSDEGLDGHCEGGIIEGSKGRIIFDSDRNEGLEHEKEFSKLYDDTVTLLLNFYQGK